MTASHPYSVTSLSEVLASMPGEEFEVTIARTHDHTFTDAGRPPRLALVVTTVEYPRNPYYPNTGVGGSVARLYELLGEDQRRWVGKSIILRRFRGVYDPTLKRHGDKFRVVGTITREH